MRRAALAASIRLWDAAAWLLPELATAGPGSGAGPSRLQAACFGRVQRSGGGVSGRLERAWACVLEPVVERRVAERRAASPADAGHLSRRAPMHCIFSPESGRCGRLALFTGGGTRTAR